MAPLMVILIAASLLLREQLPGPFLAGHLSLWQASVLTLLGLVVIGALGHVAAAWCGRRLDRTGHFRWVDLAQRVLSATRWTAIAWHTAAVIAFGWLDAARLLTGNLILIDEMIAATPVLLTIVWTWWAMHPIDRRLREAALVGLLDRGDSVYAHPTRGRFVLLQTRHQLLVTLLPLGLLVAWAESCERLLRRFARGGQAESAADRAAAWLGLGATTRHGQPQTWFDRAGEWLGDPSVRSIVLAAAQLAGAAVIFVLMPLALRFIWDTVPLGAGPLRDRLLDLCRRHGVRVRDVLVWRTDGGMINGAVLGLLGRLRYVLLTDALLDRLPTEQIEAVMAHEVGHVRRRHMPWMIVGLLACVGGCLAAIDLTLMLLSRVVELPLWAMGEGLAGQGLTLGLLSLGLAAGMAIFGVVSRRFEWQADAFAVQHLSGHLPGHRCAAPAPAVTMEAVDAMAGALESVSRLNGLPRRRFGWRHGSIQTRVDNLRALVGVPADRLRIDRTAGRIKLGIGLTAIALVVLAVVIDAPAERPPTGRWTLGPGAPTKLKLTVDRTAYAASTGAAGVAASSSSR